MKSVRKVDPIPELIEHDALLRELAAAADARDAEVERIDQSLGMKQTEEKWSALGDVVYDAEWALMDVPAPALPELLFKLEKLLTVENGSTPGWSESAIEQTMADARRLLSNGRA